MTIMNQDLIKKENYNSRWEEFKASIFDYPMRRIISNSMYLETNIISQELGDLFTKAELVWVDQNSNLLSFVVKEDKLYWLQANHEILLYNMQALGFTDNRFIASYDNTNRIEFKISQKGYKYFKSVGLI